MKSNKKRIILIAISIILIFLFYRLFNEIYSLRKIINNSSAASVKMLVSDDTDYALSILEDNNELTSKSIEELISAFDRDTSGMMMYYSTMNQNANHIKELLRQYGFNIRNNLTELNNLIKQNEDMDKVNSLKGKVLDELQKGEKTQHLIFEERDSKYIFLSKEFYKTLSYPSDQFLKEIKAILK